MPKLPFNPDDVLAAAMKQLKANRTKIGDVADDVAGAGKGLVETITKAVKGGSKPPKPKMPKNPPKSGRDVGRAVNAEEEFVAGMQPTTAEVWKNGPALNRYATKNGPDTLDAEEYATLKLYDQFIKAGKTPPTPRVPKNPPKSGRGSKPKLTPEQTAAAKDAKSLENKAAWAVKREEYNAVKRTEREARKAKNKADWAQKLDEKYGGNIVEAAKATSKSPSKANRNKKKDKK